jgi:hypothetical protein
MSDQPATEFPSSNGYDRETIDFVWRLAREVPGNDAALWRKDEDGAWIHRLDYGRRQSDFGWEIFDPGAGSAVLSLRPFHWQNYLDRVFSQTQSKVTSDGLRNVRRLL